MHRNGHVCILNIAAISSHDLPVDSGKQAASGDSGEVSGAAVPLPLHTLQDVEFNLPVGVAGANVTWVSVWCRAYSVDFGHAFLTDNIPASSPTYNISFLTILFSLGLSALLEFMEWSY